MDQDEFVLDTASIPDEDTEKFAYWQTRCLSACVDVVNLTRRLLEADLLLRKQERVISGQAGRIVHLTQELRTLTAESPWLAVVRKHLNSATPEDLDDELERLTNLYRDKEAILRDKETELLAITKRCNELKLRLSEYENSDNTPLE